MKRNHKKGVWVGGGAKQQKRRSGENNNKKVSLGQTRKGRGWGSVIDRNRVQKCWWRWWWWCVCVEGGEGEGESARLLVVALSFHPRFV